MKIQKTAFDVSKGLAEQVDDFQLPMGQLLELENCVYNKAGKISRRPGHTALSPGGPVNLTGKIGWGVATYKGTPVILHRTDRTDPLTTYLEGVDALAGTWNGVGSSADAAYRSRVHAMVGIEARDVAADADVLSYASTSHCSNAAAAGIVATAFQDTATTFRVVFADRESGGILFDSSFTGTAPRAVAVQQESSDNWHIVVFFVAGGSLLFKRWLVTGATFSSATPTATGSVGSIGGSEYYDVLAAYSDGDPRETIYIAYQDSAAPTTTVNVALYTVNGGIAGATTVTANANQCMGWLCDYAESGRALLGTAGTTDGVLVYVLNGSTLATVGSYTIDGTATSNIENITGVTTSSSTSGEGRVAYTVAGSPAKVVIGDFEPGPTVATLDWILNAKLASKLSPIVSPEATQFFALISHVSETQGTYFLHWFEHTLHATDPSCDDHPGPQSAFFQRSGGVVPANSSLGEIVRMSPEDTGHTTWAFSYAAAAVRKVRLSAVEDTFFAVGGMASAILNFNPVRELGRPVEWAGLLFVPGGQLRIFDGRNYTEYPLDLKPEEPSVASSASAGDLVPGDTRTYRLVYAIVDRAGRLHRSAPSDPATVTISGGHASCDVTCPTLRITSYDGVACPDVTIEIYGTESGKNVFRLIGTVANDPTADTVAHNDVVEDALLVGGELLYTTGAVGEELANLPPPPCLDVAMWRDRIVCIRADRRDEIWYSKSIGPNRAPGFSESLVVQLPSGVEARAVETFDDKLFVICTDRVYAVIGDPLDDTGGGVLPVIQQIATVGTRLPRSVAAHDGIWFIDDDKINHIGRDLAVMEDGAPVQDFVATALATVPDPSNAQATYQVVDVIVLPKRRQIRWHFGNASSCALNTLHGLWSRNLHKPSGGTHYVYGSTVWRGDGLLLASAATDASLLYEDDSAVQDGALTFIQKVRLPWFAPAGMRGRARIHGVSGFGTKADGIVYLNIYRNFDDTKVENRELDLDTLAINDMDNLTKPTVRKVVAASLELLDDGGADAGFDLHSVTVFWSALSPHQGLGSARHTTTP